MNQGVIWEYIIVTVIAHPLVKLYFSTGTVIQSGAANMIIIYTIRASYTFTAPE